MSGVMLYHLSYQAFGSKLVGRKGGIQVLVEYHTGAAEGRSVFVGGGGQSGTHKFSMIANVMYSVYRACIEI